MIAFRAAQPPIHHTRQSSIRSPRATGLKRRRIVPQRRQTNCKSEDLEWSKQIAMVGVAEEQRTKKWRRPLPSLLDPGENPVPCAKPAAVARARHENAIRGRRCANHVPGQARRRPRLAAATAFLPPRGGTTSEQRPRLGAAGASPRSTRRSRRAAARAATK